MEINLVQTFVLPSSSKALTAKSSRRRQDTTPTIQTIWCAVERQIVFVGRSSGEILVYSMKEGRSDIITPEITLEGHEGVVNDIVGSSEELFGIFLLFSASIDGSIRVWDPAQKICIQEMVKHSRSVTCIGIHETSVISGGLDQCVRIWRPECGREHLKYPWFLQVQVLSGFKGWITCISCSENRRVGDIGDIIVGDSVGTLTTFKDVFELGEMGNSHFELLQTYSKVHDGGILAIEFLPRESLVATICFDHSLRLMEGSTGVMYSRIVNPHHNRYTAVKWDSEWKELVLGDSKGNVDVWKYEMGSIIRSFQFSVNPITDLSLLGNYVYVANSFGVEKREIIRNPTYQETTGHEGAIVGMFVYESSEYRNVLLTAGEDNRVCEWAVFELGVSCIRCRSEPGSEVTAFCFVSGYSPVYITGHENGELRVRDMLHDLGAVQIHHHNSITCLAVGMYRPKKDEYIEFPHIISSGYDGLLVIWDLRKYKLPVPEVIDQVKVSDEEIFCLLVDEDKHTYIAAGSDSLVHVLSSTTLKEEASLKGHIGAITCLERDGNFLFSGGSDRTIRVWNTVTYSKVYVLEGHTASITSMSFLTNIGNLISCGLDGKLITWDYIRQFKINIFERSGEELRAFAQDDTGALFMGTDTGRILYVAHEKSGEVTKRKVVEEDETNETIDSDE